MVVDGWSMQSRQQAKGVVGEIRNRISIKSGVDSIYTSNGSRAAMVAHKELLRHLTIMIKTNNSVH